MAIEKRWDSGPERGGLLAALMAAGLVVQVLPLPPGLGPSPCVSTVEVLRCVRPGGEIDLPQEPEPANAEPETEVEPEIESDEARKVRLDAMAAQPDSLRSNQGKGTPR